MLLGGVCLAKPAQVQVVCPFPSTPQNGACVLEANFQISETIELASNTVIDCQGHSLRPEVPGTEHQGSSSSSVPSVPSTPVACFLINDARKVKIQNCTCDDFDFGIVAVNVKAAKTTRAYLNANRITIQGNTLTSLYQGVTIIQADNIDVTGNTIASKSGGGAAVEVMQDSDYLSFRDNQIRGSDNNPVDAPLFPGSPDLNFITIADGIDFTQPPGEVNDTFHVIVGDATISPLVNSPSQKSTNNIIEGNTFRISGILGVAIIVSELQDGLLIRNNTILTSHGGIWLGTIIQTYIDTPSLWPKNVVVENNTLDGMGAGGAKFTYGITSFVTFNPVIRGNFVTGIPTSSNSFGNHGGVAINLIGKSLETAVVTGNKIQGNLHALGLPNIQSGFGTTFPPVFFFGAKVFLNDFIDNTKSAIATSNPSADPITFPTGLSVGTCSGNSEVFCSRQAGGADDPETPVDESKEECESLGLGTCMDRQGNYWDHTCLEDGGFIEAGKPNADSPDLDIVDNYPYGEPVAEMDPLTALTCSEQGF